MPSRSFRSEQSTKRWACAGMVRLRQALVAFELVLGGRRGGACACTTDEVVGSTGCLRLCRSVQSM